MAHSAPECLISQAVEALQDKAWTSEYLRIFIKQANDLLKEYPDSDSAYQPDQVISNEWIHYYNSGAGIRVSKTPYKTARVEVSMHSYGDLQSSLTFQIQKDIKQNLTKLGLSLLKAADSFSNE